jgi:hypothetical protein
MSNAAALSCRPSWSSAFASRPRRALSQLVATYGIAPPQYPEIDDE